MLDIVKISETIEIWDEKLKKITGKYLEDPIISGIIITILFIMVIYTISNLNKR